MRYLHQIPWIVSVAVALFWMGCGSEPASQTSEDKAPSEHSSTVAVGETNTSGEIYITADETFRPIVEDLVSTFEDSYPDAHINVIYLPGEQAINTLVTEDSVRLTICARELSKDEKAELRNQATSDKTSPIAIDAIALVVNRENTDSVLSQAQIKAILTGEITSWKEINPESPLQDISLVFDHGQSSTVQYLRDRVLQGGDIRALKAYAAGTNPEVIDYVGKNKNALGVIGVAWISDSDSQQAVGFKKEITVCRLENPQPCDYPADFHQPYQGLIKLGCYPYSRTVYIISRETRWGLGSGFLNFVTSQDRGQRLILKSGLVPAFGVPRLVQFPEKKAQ